ncbi:Ig-like domain-containing protein [Chryseobacterium indologenes]|uniref:Ig-like domain-containing protein n=1 Tax=Chryseobacterium indologenes TaxID=253 RepID=UPI0023E7AFE0|nr:Ig-like domain-containing protein [Chryseobacterium indologenes]WET49758.1 Ig-like domain-containing protein [Chryseobacterium indologenes]
MKAKSIERTLSALTVFTFFNFSSAQKIISTDIDNFWTAYDSIQKNKNNKSEILETLFLNKKTDGLRSFMEIKKFGKDDYLRVIEKYPQFWNSIRPNTLIDSKKIKTVNHALRKLGKLYPNNSKGNIYYTIGALKSGGTTNNEDLLLGVEKITGNTSTVVSEFENENLRKMFLFTNPSQLQQVTVHEFIHTFQKDGEVNVLSKAIKEGSCDFIAELALNKKFTAQYLDYGFKNYETLKSEFKKEMFSKKFENWFYNNNANHPDLGYFVGYVISKKYYENSTDKRAAVKNIIELDFNNESKVLEFTVKSGYFEDKKGAEQILSEYKELQPKLIKIIEFENGSQNVNADIKKIRIVFSKPMNEKISINFSKNGKEHFPLKNILGLDESKTTLTIETSDLQNNTDYDFYITNRSTKSADGYPFDPEEYKISFKTEKK